MNTDSGLGNGGVRAAGLVAESSTRLIYRRGNCDCYPPKAGGLLCGDRVSLAKMPARRVSYETYRALPYPALIRGGFERGCNAMTDPDVPHDDMLSFLWRSGLDVPQDRGPGDSDGAGAHGSPAQQAVAFTPRPGHTPAGKHKGKAASP